jgi:hypothetical protein
VGESLTGLHKKWLATHSSMRHACRGVPFRLLFAEKGADPWHHRSARPWRANDRQPCLPRWQTGELFAGALLQCLHRSMLMTFVLTACLPCVRAGLCTSHG